MCERRPSGTTGEYERLYAPVVPDGGSVRGFCLNVTLMNDGGPPSQLGVLFLTFSKSGGFVAVGGSLSAFAQSIVNFGKRFVGVGDFVVAFEGR